MRPGRVIWIGLRPARRAPVQVVEAADLQTGLGIVGDRYGRRDGGRQVTLIAAESLAAIAGYLGLEAVDPQALRRNFVVEGINLLALKERRFRIGDALLESPANVIPARAWKRPWGRAATTPCGVWAASMRG